LAKALTFKAVAFANNTNSSFIEQVDLINGGMFNQVRSEAHFALKAPACGRSPSANGGATGLLYS
jgi:hypothetical protein